MVVMSGFLLVAAPPQAVGTWEVIGTTDPSSARSGAATATLADGSTFVAGGRLGDGTITDSVVVYDPLTNASTTVGHLLSPRVNAAAARLDDGRVLVVGGEVGVLLTADAEIFDPSTGTSIIIVGGAMAQPRTRHAAARLADGRVLIVGGATVGRRGAGERRNLRSRNLRHAAGGLDGGPACRSYRHAAHRQPGAGGGRQQRQRHAGFWRRRSSTSRSGMSSCRWTRS